MAFAHPRAISAAIIIFMRSNRNLVEQKSVLDCRRISRNFSQKRGQQKRPKQNNKKHVIVYIILYAFHRRLYTTHDHQFSNGAKRAKIHVFVSLSHHN